MRVDEFPKAGPEANKDVLEYGCCLCQQWHAEGLDPLFEPHLMAQSKIGLRTRRPTAGEVVRRLIEADGK